MDPPTENTIWLIWKLMFTVYGFDKCLLMMKCRMCTENKNDYSYWINTEWTKNSSIVKQSCKKYLPDNNIWSWHIAEITFIKEWQCSTLTVYKHNKKLYLQDCPHKLKHIVITRHVWQWLQFEMRIWENLENWDKNENFL
jgi:hypothetical protein